MSKVKNPVSFHVPHLGRICTNEKNHEEKKRTLQKIFQEYFSPTELPHTAGITIDILKHGVEGNWKGIWYSAIVNFQDMSPDSRPLINIYKNQLLGKPFDISKPSDAPVYEGLNVFLYSFNSIAGK